MSAPATSPSVAHLLLMALPAWGHVRPLLILATRLVLERENVVVTVLLPPNVIERAHSDMSYQSRHGDKTGTAQARIRIVAAFSSDNGNFFELAEPLAEAYPAAYETLVQGKPITCAVTGTVFEALPPPSAIIMDFFALPQLQATRARTGHSVPVLAFISASAAAITQIFGPEKDGGRGNFGVKVDAEAARTGRSALEVGEEYIKNTDGSVIEVAGLPPMYDYEFFPQKLAFDAPTSPLWRYGYTFFRECDAVVVQTNSPYDNSGALPVLKSWLASENTGLFTIGPLLPLGYGSEKLGSRGDSDAERFMEEMVEKYGERSVTFISFGTLFWPRDPQYIEEVIDVLIEKKSPFFFCHASHFANLSEEFINKIKASSIGYSSKWAPQQYILNHPATGWFLTHGGQGGVNESLGSGVPLICWPFEANQPGNSAHLSVNLKVAIELIEVRTGDKGMQPMLRNGRAPKGTRAAVGAEFREVIDMTRGAIGQELKRNAEAIKVAYEDSWKDGGEAKTELGALLAKYI